MCVLPADSVDGDALACKQGKHHSRSPVENEAYPTAWLPVQANAALSQGRVTGRLMLGENPIFEIQPLEIPGEGFRQCAEMAGPALA